MEQRDDPTGGTGAAAERVLARLARIEALRFEALRVEALPLGASHVGPLEARPLGASRAGPLEASNAGGSAPALLAELRALVPEAEAWARTEGDRRARAAATKLREEAEGMT